MLYASLFKISSLLLQQNIATKEVAKVTKKVAKVTKEYSKSANDGIISRICWNLYIYIRQCTAMGQFEKKTFTISSSDY